MKLKIFKIIFRPWMKIGRLFLWRVAFRSILRPPDGSRLTAHRSLTKAFSLVEVTLALMVVSVGMLAVFSLFPTGLDQGARAMHDTHAALFAEEVFSGLRIRAEQDWEQLDGANISVAYKTMWEEANSFATTNSGTNVSANVYRQVVAGGRGDTNIVDHTFRYCLAITTNGNVKGATLRVWPGRYGGISAPPNVFYAEFYKTRP